MSVTRKVGTLFGALVVVAGVAACGSGMGGGGTGSGGGGGSGNTHGGASSSASPKILSLNTNISSMTPSDMLVISAVVTDPDGIDDVIGGNLETPDGIAAYGAFATDASEGAYSITLTWNSLSTVQTIQSDAGASETRTLRATFFDVEGNTAWRDVSVTLGCGSATKAACNGRCEDLTSTQSCASCDHVCNAGYNCVLDTTGAPAGCGRQYAIPEPAPCASLCQTGNLTCVTAQAEYSDNSHLDLGCMDAPPAMHGTASFAGMRCACVD